MLSQYVSFRIHEISRHFQLRLLLVDVSAMIVVINETDFLRIFLVVNPQVHLFGDFSDYWIIERQPLMVKTLKEKYALDDMIGFSAYERLDGVLINPDAIKALQIME